MSSIHMLRLFSRFEMMKSGHLVSSWSFFVLEASCSFISGYRNCALEYLSPFIEKQSTSL